MSKLYSIYLSEKEHDKEQILLFKSGIFFISLADDAAYLSSLLGLKLVPLNNIVQKCGFPCSCFDKYQNLFKACNLKIKIIEVDKNLSYSLQQFKQNETMNDLLQMVNKVDIDNLSITEAYKFIETLKEKASQIN